MALASSLNHALCSAFSGLIDGDDAIEACISGLPDFGLAA
jgi:hypothetical protein